MGESPPATGTIHGVLVLSPYIRRLSPLTMERDFICCGPGLRNGTEIWRLEYRGGAGQECIYATVVCLDRGDGIDLSASWGRGDC